MRRLASVDELASPPFRSFLAWLNAFARTHALREHTNWSKIWEYPWSWRYLSDLRFPELKVLDIGSEISPMPWFFASLGADVFLVEADSAHFAKWDEIRSACGFSVKWSVSQGPGLPFPDDSFDLVTSFSVIEHVPEKQRAIDEAVRVLKPGGTLCLTFDICETSRGMTFPEWNGSALDLASFESLIWNHPQLEPLDASAPWNLADIDPFIQWHRQTAPHHNYVVGGAILQKKRRPAEHREGAALRVHCLDTGLGSGNVGDDAMFLGAFQMMPSQFSLTCEVHSIERGRQLPSSARYVSCSNISAVEQSIRESDFVLMIGDTPVMDQWGLAWPLQSIAPKLECCHRHSKPVHAVGVGVDRLQHPDAARIFRDSYAKITSWTVRSIACRAALVELGVPEDRILVGADWAWLYRPELDREWASRYLSEAGAVAGKRKLGVNLVNEIWRGEEGIKRECAALLDRLVERFDLQVIFLSNESRTGDYFDRAAAEDVMGRMRNPSILVESRYWEPSQMMSLLSQMDLTISMRYHFTLFSILADVYPISVQRGQKIKALNEELGLPFVGDMEHLEASTIENEVAQALDNPESKIGPLRICRKHLETRACNNLALARAIEYK